MTEPTLSLAGRAALITGGGRGIGRAIATLFLAQGAAVTICGRTEPATLPEAGGNRAGFIACDVRDAAQAARLVAETAAAHGRLDVLVNNAGGSPHADSATASSRFSERIVALNLLAPLYCAQAARPIMAAQPEGGTIINIASVSGTRPSPGTAAYGAAKAGLLNLTETLAQEWGPRVRVNAIVAGLIATEEAAATYGDAAAQARIAARIPLHRFGTGEDIAAACLYLASPLGAYVSGAKLAVHGGGERPLFLELMAQETRE